MLVLLACVLWRVSNGSLLGFVEQPILPQTWTLPTRGWVWTFKVQTLGFVWVGAYFFVGTKAHWTYIFFSSTGPGAQYDFLYRLVTWKVRKNVPIGCLCLSLFPVNRYPVSLVYKWYAPFLSQELIASLTYSLDMPLAVLQNLATPFLVFREQRGRFLEELLQSWSTVADWEYRPHVRLRWVGLSPSTLCPHSHWWPPG